MPLGRGLDALLSDSRKAHKLNNELDDANPAETDIAGAHIEEIVISQLRPSVYQPRKNFYDEGITELSDSIKENGLLEPLLVNKSENGGYEIICGERRFRACKLAGLTKIPCIVKNLLPKDSYAAALIENIQREDLNPLEQAVALEQMMNECHMTQEELARSLGKPRSGISNLLRLNSLEQNVKNLLSEGKIDFGHAKVIMGLDKDLQVKTAEYIVKKNLSVRQTEIFVKNLKKQKPDNIKKQEKNPELENLEKKFTDKYNDLHLCIQGRNNKKGKIILGYSSKEEFKHIINILNIGNEGE